MMDKVVHVVCQTCGWRGNRELVIAHSPCPKCWERRIKVERQARSGMQVGV